MAFPISCASCGASFNIPDEIYQRRVAGRLVTIKCKHCRAPIQVDGRQADTHDKLGKSGAKDAALKDRKAEAPAETPTGGAASEAAASGGTGGEHASTPRGGDNTASRGADSSDDSVPSSGTRSGLGWQPSRSSEADSQDNEEASAPSRRRVVPPEEAEGDATFESSQERDSEPPESGPAAIMSRRTEQRSGLSVQPTRSIEGDQKPNREGDRARPPDSEPPTQAAEASTADLWAVSFSEDDDRELTDAEIREELARGAIDGDTLVWCEGMPGWEPLAQVPALAHCLPAPKTPAAVPTSEDDVGAEPLEPAGVTPDQPGKLLARTMLGAGPPSTAPAAPDDQSGRLLARTMLGAGPLEPAPVAPDQSGGLLARTMLGVGPTPTEEQEETPALQGPTQQPARPSAPQRGVFPPVEPANPQPSAVSAQASSPPQGPPAARHGFPAGAPAPAIAPVAPNVAAPPMVVPAPVPALVAPNVLAPPAFDPGAAASPMSVPSPGQLGPVSSGISHPAGADPFSPWGQSSPASAPPRVNLDLEIMPPMRKRAPVLWIAAGAVVVLVGVLFALASTSGGGTEEAPALVPAPSSGPVDTGSTDTRSTSLNTQAETSGPAASETRTDLLSPPSSAQEPQSRPKKSPKRGFTDAFARQLDERKRKK